MTNTTDSEVQKNIKLSDDKKTLEFLIVSNTSLKKSGGTIDIGEIDIISENNKAIGAASATRRGTVASVGRGRDCQT